MNYYSQFRQDRFIDKVIFCKKKNGYFVDIGAYDGKTISNTYFLEKERDWKGICFEPNPTVFINLKNNRKCQIFNCCIGNLNGNSLFFQVVGDSEMLSGLKSAYDPRHIDRIHRETKVNNGFINEIVVEVKPLIDFLPEGQVVDYLSVDTEGNEFEIIESIDFSRNDFNSISIENNYKNKKIEDFLLSKGYKLIVRLSCDQIYVKRSLIDFSMIIRIFVWKFKSRMIMHKKGIQKRLGINYEYKN